jgi:hypothetical protein
MPPNFPFKFRRRCSGDEKNPKDDLVNSDPFYLGSTEHFVWRATSGVKSIEGIDWIRKQGIQYLEDAYLIYKKEILQVGDLRRLPAIVNVKSSAECQGGISGATANGELSYGAGIWNQNQFCYGILAHELCNAFTGECVSGAWPVEWWANHRSPFPTVAANEVMRRIVPQFYEQWGDYNDPLVQMFAFFFRNYDAMFPRMMQKMQEMKVSLEGLIDPQLSHLIYYFMFHGANKNIGRYFVSPPMPRVNYSIFQRLEERFGLGVIDLPLE